MRTLPSSYLLSLEDLAVVLIGLLVITLLFVLPTVVVIRDLRAERPDPGLDGGPTEAGEGRARR